MIVVTGGAGFIGSNIARGLNGQGEDQIVIVDDLQNGAKHLNLSGVRFIDYLDREDFLNQIHSFGTIRAVIHQGACTTTTETDGRHMMRVNFDYSKELLKFCLGQRIPFIYASSASVYGRGSRTFSEDPENERPMNVYAFSKLAFDNYVRAHKNRFETQVSGLRYFNVYGPNERHKGEMSSVPYKLFCQHSSGQKLELFEGSDNFKRDFIHVDDVVRVNIYLFENRISGLYNCGTGEARSFYDVGRLVSSNLGSPALDFVPMPQALKRQYQEYTCSDNSRLRGAGYDKPFISLEDGIGLYMRCLIQAEGALA